MFKKGGKRGILIGGAIKGLVRIMSLGNSQESSRMTPDVLCLELLFLLLSVIHTSFLSVLIRNVISLKITSCISSLPLTPTTADLSLPGHLPYFTKLSQVFILAVIK